MRSQILWTQMLFSPLSVPITFSLEPLPKIVQGIKELPDFIDKCNHTLREHSVATTTAVNKLMSIGTEVQKHISH